MCSKQAKSGWREMSSGSGEIDSPAEWNILFQLFCVTCQKRSRDHGAPVSRDQNAVGSKIEMP